MIVFQKNELLKVDGAPARFFGQNHQEYLFVMLNQDWTTEKNLIRVPADFIHEMTDREISMD